MRAKCFSFTGWSNSGKTTVITRLMAGFKERGKEVLVVKNVPHKYHLEPEGKDSFKFLESGAREVLLVARDEIVTLQKKEKEEQIFQILEAKTGADDIIFLEGLHRESIPVIEVFDSRKNTETKFPLSRLTAIVTDLSAGEVAPLPRFDFKDISGLINFLEEYNG